MKQYTTPRGVVFTYTPPRDTQDVLDFEVFAMAPVYEAIAANKRLSRDTLEHVWAWVISHIEDVSWDGPPLTWSRYTHDQKREAFDHLLESPSEALTMGRAMIESVSLPEKTVKSIEGYLLDREAADCKCRVCRGFREDTIENRRQFGCALLLMDTSVAPILTAWAPVMEDDVLNAPYYLAQLKTALMNARGKKRESERKERERRAYQDRVMGLRRN